MTDERSIPVIIGSEVTDSTEPLVSEGRIEETVRGIMAEAFDPEPDAFVVVGSRAGYTRIVAVHQGGDVRDGDTVLGRIRGELVVGKLRGEEIEIVDPNPRSGRGVKRIARDAADLRIEGVVIGSLTGRKDSTRLVSCDRTDQPALTRRNAQEPSGSRAGSWQGCKVAGGVGSWYYH